MVEGSKGMSGFFNGLLTGGIPVGYAPATLGRPANAMAISSSGYS